MYKLSCRVKKFPFPSKSLLLILPFSRACERFQ